MRKATVALLAVVAVGYVALALEAAGDKRRLAFTLGVVPAQVAASVPPGHVACQSPVDASADFDRVAIAGAPGTGPLRVSVRTAPGGAPLGSGTLASAKPTPTPVAVGHVPGNRRIAVCVRNDGRRVARLLGNAELAARGTTAFLDGHRLPTDLALVFERRHARSMLSMLPTAFRRAALFRGLGAGPLLYWLLLAAVVVAVPGLAAWAVWRAGAEGRR